MASKQKKGPSIKNIANVLVSIFATAFIVLGTLLVIYYAKGYRINRDLSDFEKTGVLSIESDPLRATILLEGEVIGRTPKTISSLKEGTYDVQLIRDKYIPWKTEVEIVGEKSTPIHPTLFLAEGLEETVFKIDNDLNSITKPERSNYVFIATEKAIQNNVALTNAETGDQEIPDVTDPRAFNSVLYKIWRYETTPGIWGNQQNPRLIFEMNVSNATDLDLRVSDNGEHAIAIVTSDVSGTTEYSTYYLDTSLINNPKPIDLSGFVQNYDINWSKDNEYLVLESENEIVSYNISANTKYLLKKKTEELIWSTDPEGNFNYMKMVAPVAEGEKPYMQIMQTALTGSRSEVLVDKIYYGADNKLLLSESALLETEDAYIFTNSPSSTQFAGEITEFDVITTLDYVSITTEFAMYLYDITTGKYMLVSVQPGSFHHVSPDLTRILYSNATGLFVYTFDKESADHTTDLGSQLLLSGYKGGLQDIKWRTDSMIIYYFRDGDLNYIDVNGENKNKLIDFGEQFFSTDSSGDYIFGIKMDENERKELVRVRVR